MSLLRIGYFELNAKLNRSLCIARHAAYSDVNCGGANDVISAKLIMLLSSPSSNHSNAYDLVDLGLVELSRVH